MCRRATAMLATAFLLCVPAPVLAQSAGDDQYRDPFAGDGRDQSDTGSGGGTQGEAGAPAPSAPPAAPTSAPTDSTTVEPTVTTAATLPRTGPAAGWITAAGVLALLAGAGLRRTART